MKVVRIREFTIRIYGNPVIYYIVGGDCVGKGVIYNHIADNIKNNFCLCSAKVPGFPETYIVSEDVDTLFIIDEIRCEDDLVYLKRLQEDFIVKEIHLIRDIRVCMLCTTSYMLHDEYVDSLGAQYDRIKSCGDSVYIVKYEDILSGYNMSDIFCDISPNIFEGYKISNPHNTYVSKSDLNRILKIMIGDEWKLRNDMFLWAQSQFKDYINYFGYSDNLTISGVLV